jgi:hypothetical protein
MPPVHHIIMCIIGPSGLLCAGDIHVIPFLCQAFVLSHGNETGSVSKCQLQLCSGLLVFFSGGFFFSFLSEFDVYHTGRLSHVLWLPCMRAFWASRELIAAVLCTQLWNGQGNLEITTNLSM